MAAAVRCPKGAITVTGRRLRPEDAVELPPEDRRATADQLDGLLLARRSVRHFSPEEVDRPVLDRLLEITSTAPMGVPPSDVGILVFHGREKVRQFVADAMGVFRRQLKVFSPLVLTLMRPFYKKADYQMVRDFVRPVYRSYLADWERGKDRFCYGSPLVLLFHQDGMADQGDSYVAATYAMLAAESLGLGSCMLGMTVGLGYDKRFRAKYGIPVGDKIGLALTIGHPVARFRRGVRRRLASVRFV
jgi:nitroreductase